MSEDKFDAIIVGAGLAGSVCAHVLASAGLETLVVERGNSAGAKNVSGGRLYAHSLEHLLPGFADEAPIERLITREKISFMTSTGCTTLDYAAQADPNHFSRSYSVLRANFDSWLAGKAEDAGASMITGIRVDDLIVRNGTVCGIVAGDEEMLADVVVLADGVNSMLAEKLGMGTKVTPHHCAVGVKEIIELGEERINDRFGCMGNEGTAWLIAGTPSDNLMGGAFLYTNKETVSLGVVFGLHNIQRAGNTVPQMLENVKNHPAIAPVIAGGKMVEYSAHLVPEGGLDMLPRLAGNGVLLTGDAAGLCLNVGYTVRGMDMAIASGEAAAKAIIEAKSKGDFSTVGLAGYEAALKESFVLKDMELYKHMPKFLDTDRMYREYPEMVTGIMHDLFAVNGPSKPLRRKLFPHLRRAGLFNLVKDGIKGMRAI